MKENVKILQSTAKYCFIFAFVFFNCVLCWLLKCCSIMNIVLTHNSEQGKQTPLPSRSAASYATEPNSGKLFWMFSRMWMMIFDNVILPFQKVRGFIFQTLGTNTTLYTVLSSCSGLNNTQRTLTSLNTFTNTRIHHSCDWQRGMSVPLHFHHDTEIINFNEFVIKLQTRCA